MSEKDNIKVDMKKEQRRTSKEIIDGKFKNHA